MKPLIVNLLPVPWTQARSARTEDGPDLYIGDRMLKQAGFEVELIDPGGRPWNPFSGRHGAYQGLDPLRALKILVRRRHAAIIVAGGAGGESTIFFLLLLRRLFRFKPPLVVAEMAWSEGWKYRDALNRFVIPRADCVIVRGTNQVIEARRIYGPSICAVFVPFGIDVDYFQRQGSGGSQPYVFSSGLDAGRDFTVLARALRGLDVGMKIKSSADENLPFNAQEFPNVEIVKKRLPYGEFRALYEGARVVVVSTQVTRNACGVTSLMEAMAMGKPVIVSDNPALRDYLPPPDAGIVVPVGDENALRHAILKLWNNPQEAALMGERARQFAAANFSIKNTVRKTIEVYLDILKRQKSKL